MRAGSLEAIEDDQKLRAFAASSNFKGAMRALENSGKLSELASAQEDSAAVWGHGNARWRL